jgi:hypothetical protein
VLTFRRMEQFTDDLFDDRDPARKAALILKAILEARSPRLSDISQEMPGNPESNYKALQRFLKAADPREALLRLYQEDAPFILLDPTEIPRPQARKTEYVGRLQDGKTRGFWLLILAVPYRGRAIPFHLITYSSKTIADEGSSRNLEHRRALEELGELIEGQPVVMDREFSYENLFADFEEEEIEFVCRLNTGNHPTFYDEEGNKVILSLKPGERVFRRGLYYKGKIKVNVAGEWEEGFKQPLWIITNLEPEEGLRIYRGRMKIDESFKDLKSLLNLEKVMNKQREQMEKMVALVLLAYAIGLLVGEAIRDRMYGGNGGGGSSSRSRSRSGSRSRGAKEKGRKWRLYSGLFVLLKQKLRLGREDRDCRGARVLQKAGLGRCPILCLKVSELRWQPRSSSPAGRASSGGIWQRNWQPGPGTGGANCGPSSARRWSARRCGDCESWGSS